MSQTHQCGTCDGSGSVDSGGFEPWGSPILTECPECRHCEAQRKLAKSLGIEPGDLVELTSLARASTVWEVQVVGLSDSGILSTLLEFEWRDYRLVRIIHKASQEMPA